MVDKAIDMRRLTIIALLLGVSFSPACIPVFCIACDGLFAAKGEVYEWLDAPAGAQSVVFIDQKPADHVKVAPILDADITLDRWSPPNRRTKKDANQFHMQMKSDESGHFGRGITVRPGRFDAIISVSAPGFRPAERRFKHDRPSHIVRVLLVRDR